MPNFGGQSERLERKDMKHYDTTTIKGRLSEYIIKVERSGFRDFERRMGFSEGMISRPGGFSISSLENIAKKCPDLSLRWLLTGEGIMTENRGDIVINEGVANQVAGKVQNMGKVTNITNNYDNNCDDERKESKEECDIKVRILEDRVVSLERTNQSLHEENIKLIGIVERLTAK